MAGQIQFLPVFRCGTGQEQTPDTERGLVISVSERIVIIGRCRPDYSSVWHRLWDFRHEQHAYLVSVRIFPTESGSLRCNEHGRCIRRCLHNAYAWKLERQRQPWIRLCNDGRGSGCRTVRTALFPASRNRQYEMTGSGFPDLDQTPWLRSGNCHVFRQDMEKGCLRLSRTSFFLMIP